MNGFSASLTLANALLLGFGICFAENGVEPVKSSLPVTPKSSGPNPEVNGKTNLIPKNKSGSTSSVTTPFLAPDAMAKGNALYEKGDYSAAADQYRLVVRSNAYPLQKAYAWMNLGHCQVQAKAYQKAIVAYRRSTELAPSFSRAWSVLGDLYTMLGAVGEATACFQRVIENEGDDFHAQQMLGELALKGGEVTDALRHLDAAEKLEPEEANLYLAEAEALTHLRDFEAAQKVMEQALLRLSKPPAEAYFYLGELYEIDGKPRKAIRAYEEGLSLNPKHKEYWFRIANLHQKAGDDFLALLTLEQAIKTGNQDAEFSLRRGLIFFTQKRYDQALVAFKTAYQLGSLQARRGIQNIVAVYANNGNKKKAEEIEANLNLEFNKTH